MNTVTIDSTTLFRLAKLNSPNLPEWAIWAIIERVEDWDAVDNFDSLLDSATTYNSVSDWLKGESRDIYDLFVEYHKDELVQMVNENEDVDMSDPDTFLEEPCECDVYQFADSLTKDDFLDFYSDCLYEEGYMDAAFGISSDGRGNVRIVSTI